MGVTVTIVPSKVELFAGETQLFVATVVGSDDRAVTWAIQEQGGGTITSSGLYTAPKLQGLYHVVASSRGNPQKKAVAAVTVLTYYDPPPAHP